MKNLWVLICILGMTANSSFATTPKAAVKASSSVQSRWKEYVRNDTGIYFYDRQTVKPEVQDLLNGPKSGIPVIINAWTKTEFKNGITTEPQRAYVDCRFKENLAPESPSEKLYNALCLHPATMQAVNQAIESKKSELTTSINADLERKRAEQEASAIQTRQYQAQQMNSMVQNTLWQGVGLVNSFRR